MIFKKETNFVCIGKSLILKPLLFKCVNKLVAVIYLKLQKNLYCTLLLLSVVSADKMEIAFSTSLFSYRGTIISIVAKVKRRETNQPSEVLHNFYILYLGETVSVSLNKLNYLPDYQLKFIEFLQRKDLNRYRIMATQIRQLTLNNQFC